MTKKRTIKDFKKAKYNPRRISETALKALDKSIEEFGDLSGVVINKRTDTIVAGHQRLTTLSNKKTRIVTDPYIDEFGTVETGNIEVKTDKGMFRVPLRIVDWDSRKEKLANIAANKHGGKFDEDKLSKLLVELDQSTVFDVELTGFTSTEFQNIMRREKDQVVKNRYVRKLTSPIYKPTGKKPKLSDLIDRTKTIELRKSIKESNLPKDVTQMLLCAAERHTKFKFDTIAEYYAHAPKEVQGLMEDCALVIVDHNKAIEHGYLKLTEEIMDMVETNG